MKYCLLLSICMLILVACKKSDTVKVDPKEIRIQQTKSVLVDGSTSYRNFEYDAEGRIVHINFNERTLPATHTITISYSGNNALINEEWYSGGELQMKEIKLALDGARKPLQRISLQRNKFSNNDAITQEVYNTDTIVYKYDASNLLENTVSSGKDSTWYVEITGDTSFQIKIIKSKSGYVNVKGNLSGLETRKNESISNYTSSGVFTDTRETKEFILYNYETNFPNTTDYLNAFLLNEFNLPLTDFFPANSKYKNLPGRIKYISSTRGTGGVLISSLEDSTSYTAQYNRYGFLEKIQPTLNSGVVTEFIYNK